MHEVEGFAKKYLYKMDLFLTRSLDIVVIAGYSLRRQE